MVQHYNKGPLPAFKNLGKEVDVPIGIDAFIGHLILESAFISNQRKNIEFSPLPGNDNSRGLTNKAPRMACVLAHINTRLVFKCDFSTHAFRKSLYKRKFLCNEVIDFRWILLSCNIAKLLRTQPHFI